MQRSRGLGGGKRWSYFGNSKDAYTPDTQGLGPFCGHANGTIVMREPDEPWLHWHRQDSPLDLPKDHPLSKDAFHRNQTTGKWYFGEPRHLSAMIDRGTKAWFDPPPLPSPDYFTTYLHWYSIFGIGLRNDIL